MPTKEIVTEQPVKHTPHGLGALTVFTRAIVSTDHSCLAEVTVKDSQARSVAGITIRPHRTDAQHIAAGHVFAAAPEMLDVLKTTASNISSLGPAGALRVLGPYEIWLQTVEDAIAKAEGR